MNDTKVTRENRSSLGSLITVEPWFHWRFLKSSCSGTWNEKTLRQSKMQIQGWIVNSLNGHYLSNDQSKIKKPVFARICLSSKCRSFFLGISWKQNFFLTSLTTDSRILKALGIKKNIYIWVCLKMVYTPKKVLLIGGMMINQWI